MPQCVSVCMRNERAHVCVSLKRQTLTWRRSRCKCFERATVFWSLSTRFFLFSFRHQHGQWIVWPCATELSEWIYRIAWIGWYFILTYQKLVNASAIPHSFQTKCALQFHCDLYRCSKVLKIFDNVDWCDVPSCAVFHLEKSTESQCIMPCTIYNQHMQLKVNRTTICAWTDGHCKHPLLQYANRSSLEAAG